MSSALRAHLVLARPAMLPWLLLLVLVGYGFAHWDFGLDLREPGALLRVLLAWTLLHVGTLWRNAARDRDQGAVLFGESAPPPPGLARRGDLALVACVLVAGRTEALLAALLALAYSHPATAWKGHPVLGPLVNLLGYGVLTPLAGWRLVGAPASPRGLVVLALVALAMLGLTFAGQAFQQAEDRARGDRTLVATHGPRVAVGAARLCLDGAVLGVLGLAAAGWLPRACLVAAPVALVLDRHLAGWARDPAGRGEAPARRAAVLLLALGVALVGGATGAWLWASATGAPPSGLGTAIVPRF